MSRRKGLRPVLPVAEVVASVALLVDEPAEPALDIPADWNLGALLNVRNGGESYIVTLYPEEADYRHPERQLRFPNTARCQDFVSSWYARTFHDPRAG